MKKETAWPSNSPAILFKRGTTAQFKAVEWVPNFGMVLLNTETWELYCADGMTRVCDLEPIGFLPENMRDYYVYKGSAGDGK